MSAEKKDATDENDWLVCRATPYIGVLTFLSVVDAISFKPLLNSSPPKASLPSVSLPYISRPASIQLYIRPPCNTSSIRNTNLSKDIHQLVRLMLRDAYRHKGKCISLRTEAYTDKIKVVLALKPSLLVICKPFITLLKTTQSTERPGSSQGHGRWTA